MSTLPTTSTVSLRVLEHSPDACALLDDSLSITFANPRFAALFHRDHASLVGTPFATLWPPEAAEQMAANIRLAQSGGSAVEVELPCTPRDAWYSITAVPLGETTCVYLREVSDAKRLALALEASQRRYRTLLEKSPLSVQILSPDGQTQWVNDAFVQLWGLGLDDLQGYNVLQDPQLEELGIAEPLRRAFAGESLELPRRRYDARRVRPEGGVREVRGFAYPIFDHDGVVSEVVLTHEDVTEAAEAKEKFSTSEQRLRLVLNAVGAGTWDYDLANERLEWSPEQRALLGVRDSVEASMPFFESLIHSSDRESARQAFSRVITSGETLNIEFRMLLPRKGERRIAAVGLALPGPDGSPERVVGINFDVTDRIRTEEVLKRTERSLALAMKGGRMGYWTRDLAIGSNQDRVEWSPELEEVFGLPPGSFAGKRMDFLDLIYPEDRQKISDVVGHAVRTNGDYAVEFRFIHQDGSVRWMEGRGRVTADAAGNPMRIDGIGIDITHQKRAEEALKRSEERFRRLANAVPSFVWTARPDGVVDYLNEQWERYTGLASSESLSGGWMEARHPEDRTSASASWWDSVANGRPYRAEIRYRRHDGNFRWFLVNAEPVRSKDGDVVGWFGTSTEIHEQKQTESTLRLLITLGESTRNLTEPDEIIATCERLLRTHLLADRCAYAEFDPDQLHTRIARDDCDGCDSIVGEYLVSDFGPQVLASYAAGRPHVVFDSEREIPSGAFLERYRRIQIRAAISVAIRREDRLVAALMIHQTTPREWSADEIELVGMVADRCWTEIARARATIRLSASETQYREIAETLPQIVWSTLPNGTRDYVNARWHQYAGAPSDNNDFIHPEDQARADAKWRQSIATGELYEIEYRLRRHDGVYRWFLARALPIRDGGEQIVRWFGTATDIQDQKEAEAELERRVRERTAELEFANRELEGFTYTVSHDLRAPLRAITASSMILMEEAGDRLGEDERALLERQAANAKRLGVLIDELLRLTRISRVEMATTLVDLSAMASDILRELGDDSAGTLPEFRVDATRPAWADRNLARLVLLNLLENAIKFSPKGGLVHFGQTDSGAYFVKDSGIGFDPKYISKLFLPFERLVSDQEFPGTGIGLANVKRIIERHGGEVWAESTPNAGATFFFTIPDRNLP